MKRGMEWNCHSLFVAPAAEVNSSTYMTIFMQCMICEGKEVFQWKKEADDIEKSSHLDGWIREGDMVPMKMTNPSNHKKSDLIASNQPKCKHYEFMLSKLEYYNIL